MAGCGGACFSFLMGFVSCLWSLREGGRGWVVFVFEFFYSFVYIVSGPLMVAVVVVVGRRGGVGNLSFWFCQAFLWSGVI